MENDVKLTLTSGKFGRVFGGNKSGGKLKGSITVNIEEGNCDTPLVIGELYAGGNLAPYSIYGYKADGSLRTEAEYNDPAQTTDEDKEAEGIASGSHNSPILNVRAFTSIGNIYGGGLGEDAVMIGSPTVNINEVKSGFAGDDYAGETRMLTNLDNTTSSVYLYPHTTGEIGVIGNVYGGGNAAKVIGDTNVNIGTKTKEVFESEEAQGYQKAHDVVGADIRGNVYGGGNQAEVTGKTNVVIGAKKQ